jgi:hypothetical protein
MRTRDVQEERRIDDGTENLIAAEFAVFVIGIREKGG